MADRWTFYARDPAAFRAWQTWHLMKGPRPEPPPQPGWVKLNETMPADSQRSAVKAHVLKLAQTHGVVKACWLRHEIAVFERYVVDRSPRDTIGQK